MNVPIRKQIRLNRYDYSQNNIYFVTICTYNRAKLFSETVGAHRCVRPDKPSRIIEKWILALEEKYENITIDKYVITPDHIHLLIRISGAHAGAPIPEIVKWFKTQTTNEYIKGVKSNLFPAFDRHIWLNLETKMPE